MERDASDMHPADLYDETRRRVTAIATELDPTLAVPACPGWSVHDVIAHVVGLVGGAGCRAVEVELSGGDIGCISAFG